MISTRDSLASSWPATSAKVTPVDFSIYTLALDLPTPPRPPCRRPGPGGMRKTSRATMRIMGTT